MTGFARHVRSLVSPVVFMAVVLPGVAAAHPHVFVNTGLRPVLDDKGGLAGVEVTWRYDEFYSLLVLEDLELDDDYDGKLKPAEMARLDGFDMQWVDGYEGDLYISRDGQKVSLGKPEPRGTTFEDGQIETRHYRPVTSGGGTPGGPWLIEAYDPTYYTAYDMTLGVSAPEGCTVKITPADLDKAYTLVEQALYGQPADPEGNFPEVGEAFADKVMLTCDAGS